MLRKPVACVRARLRPEYGSAHSEGIFSFTNGVLYRLLPSAGRVSPSVLGDQRGINQPKTMVNKTDTIEGAAKTAARTAPKRRATVKAASVRVPGAIAGTKKAAPKTKRTKTAPAASHEDVALRAYLIGERRQQAGQPGDATSDWLQAERELLG